MSDSTQNPPPEGSSYQPPPPPPESQAPGAQPGYGQAPPAQPGYGPGPGVPASGVGQPADLLPRFLARLIDGLILAVVNFVLVGAVVVATITGASSGVGLSNGSSFAASALYAILSTAISLGYFVLLESRRGQTVGKMALKLQTQGPDGGRPTTEQSLRRNAFLAIALIGIIPFLGLLASLATLAAYITIAVTINSSPTHQGWHDNFAGGTKVIKIG